MPESDGLIFRIADLERQLKQLHSSANSFLAPGSRGCLESAADRLQGAYREAAKATGKHREFRWSWPKDEPVQTVESSGCYQPGGHGGKTVVGRLSFIWELKAASSQGFAELAGNASISCRIGPSKEGADDLASWNFDIGDANAPGTLLHVQQTLVNSNLDVPRWHSIVVTPADALDFLLGELFQDAWPKRQAAQQSMSSQFRKAQLKIIRPLMCGILDCIDKEDNLSALMALKRWKPSANIFSDS